MEQVLNNPVWSALCTGNSHLALGDEQIKYFHPEVSPFVALKDTTAENFERLAEEITHPNPSIFCSATEIEIPEPWKVVRVIPGYQMVHNGTPVDIFDSNQVAQLAEQDVPAMLALTQLTKPGPFATRTIEFGHYAGIFEGDELAAMAGQRFLPKPYAEISAVCTHPSYAGKGYARQLMAWQVSRIIAAGNIPMLHVAASNERAIKVYESVGFAIRIPVWFYVMMKRA